MRYPNEYFRNRSQGIRFKLEQNYLNKMQYYLNTEMKPMFRYLLRTNAGKELASFPSKHRMLMRKFEKKMLKLAEEHFTDILKLSLTEKYGAWHRVPSSEVRAMRIHLMKQSRFQSKAKFLTKRAFDNIEKHFFLNKEEREEENYLEKAMDQISDSMNKSMSAFGRTVYTHSTYFINSAYEIQYRNRDPQKKFLYIWGTRPDHRRTAQCTMIDQMVTDEAKKKNKIGLSLDRLKEIVTQVSNMEGFKKASPGIDWTPHYNCRSGIIRVVI